MRRRDFIRNSTLSLPAVHSLTKPSPNQPLPVVVSTWDFGKAANAAAWKILSAGGKAIDAIEAGARITEADQSNKTVGYGGYPDRDGHVTLDACIMDEHGNCGSVMCLEHIMHPISVARKVMEKTPHVILVGQGALQFALQNGFTKHNLLTPDSEEAWKEWLKKSEYKPVMNIENSTYQQTPQADSFPGSIDNHDTIGILALDSSRNLSGGCTTSGMAFKMHGRVGDSPVIGAGLFVDNEVGAATSTGVGEEVIKCVGSHLVVELMRQGYTAPEACKKAVERIANRDLKKAREIQIGFLALDKKGNHGAYALQKGFTYSVRTPEKEIVMESDYHFIIRPR
ncbi:MAG: N(4)-(beta-N-acetylglucosaminyl)-L-asparaginase [Chitinophagaceae bacterium]